MNLSEAKKKALSLMAEYSVDGVQIPDGENADYLNRMNRFANDAQMELSDKLGIESSMLISQVATNESGYFKYDLPADFKEHRYMNIDDERFFDYRIENRKILISKSLTGGFEFFYFKNPDELTSDTPDTYQFEIELHAQHLIPYFMGGMALQDENPSMSDRLLNTYYAKFQNLTKMSDDYPNFVHTTFTM